MSKCDDMLQFALGPMFCKALRTHLLNSKTSKLEAYLGSKKADQQK